MRRVLAAAVLAGAALAAAPVAAQAQGAQGLRLAGQRGHSMCPFPGREAQAWLIDEPSRWHAAVDAATALGREIQWGQEMLLVVAMAQQPTLGVRVTLDDSIRQRWGGRLQLEARVQRPGPGEMAPTAISRPCVVAAVPKVRWRRVTVRLEGRQLDAERASTGAPRTHEQSRRNEALPAVLEPASVPR